MQRYSNNSIQSALNICGLPCTIKDVVSSYTTSTYTIYLDGGNTPQTIKKAMGGLEIAVGQKIDYTAYTGSSNTIRVSIPNPTREYPNFLEYVNQSIGIPGNMLVGIDENCEPIISNITETLSILVAGATGSGKSVALNNLIMSLALTSSPKQLEFRMIDLKRTELSIYDNLLPHLKDNVEYTFEGAIRLIRTVADEIDKRYITLQEKGKRKADLDDFPILVLVIDEYAQLKQGTKEARDMIDNLMNKVVNLGRACNVFAIIATQNPVTQVINSTIKYGCQTKICLAVNNIRHSVNIIDCKKAIDLLGRGDALFSCPQSPELKRVQVCSLNEKEILNIIN